MVLNGVDYSDNLSPLIKEADINPTIFEQKSKDQLYVFKSEDDKNLTENKKGWLQFETDIKWLNIIILVTFHILGIYNLFTFPYLLKWRTILWEFFIGCFAIFGVTAGVHRHWSHRAFKANIPLKIILAFTFLLAGQSRIYDWVQEHRVHHKYSDTRADPHNSTRGFFYSHIGWLMLERNSTVIEKCKRIDMSDIERDPVATFTDRHFQVLKILHCFVIPIAVPVIFWNEEWYYSSLCMLSRHMLMLHGIWSINSFAHFFGNKPYDKNIASTDNSWVSTFTLGEGWHNYHHTFPNDYRTAEIGNTRSGYTTLLIEFFAKIGWAYDLKEPSKKMVKVTLEKKGDGSHESVRLISKNL